MAALGCCLGLSLVGMSGNYCVAAWASRCSGFSCRWAQALGRAGFSGCSTGAARGLPSSGEQAWFLYLHSAHGNLPGPGTKPVSSALAGGFLTIGPLEKSNRHFLITLLFQVFAGKKSYQVFWNTQIRFFCDRQMELNSGGIHPSH